jgi:hypothetical protein
MRPEQKRYIIRDSQGVHLGQLKMPINLEVTGLMQEIIDQMKADGIDPMDWTQEMVREDGFIKVTLTKKAKLTDGAK